MRLVVIGGSDAGISAALRARELDHMRYYPGSSTLHLRVLGDVKSGRLLGAQILGATGAEVSKRLDIFATARSIGLRGLLRDCCFLSREVYCGSIEGTCRPRSVASAISRSKAISRRRDTGGCG